MAKWENTGDAPIRFRVAGQSHCLNPGESIYISDKWDYALESMKNAGHPVARLVPEVEWAQVAKALDTTLEKLQEENPAQDIIPGFFTSGRSAAPEKAKPKKVKRGSNK